MCAYNAADFVTVSGPNHCSILILPEMMIGKHNVNLKINRELCIALVTVGVAKTLHMRNWVG